MWVWVCGNTHGDQGTADATLLAWTGTDGDGKVQITPPTEDGVVLLRAVANQKPLDAGESMVFQFSLLPTPVKPLSMEKLFNTRYLHSHLNPHPLSISNSNSNSNSTSKPESQTRPPIRTRNPNHTYNT